MVLNGFWGDEWARNLKVGAGASGVTWVPREDTLHLSDGMRWPHVAPGEVQFGY